MGSWDRRAKVALLSIISNTTLIILKIIAGILSGSVSIISEAIHSGMDLIASLIAFFSVRQSAKPADKSIRMDMARLRIYQG
jgi:divalent metal cation (Fe/Co/Zn/Cd) transporter